MNLLRQILDLILGHARHLHDTFNRCTNRQEVFGNLNKSFRTTFSKAFNKAFGTTFNTSLAKSVRKTFGFCGIQRVLISR